MKYEKRTFEGETIRLDGNTYSGCDFRRCTIAFGGGVVQMDGCSFDGCTWQVTDAALRTLQVLGMLRQTPGLDTIVDNWLDDVRKGPPKRR